MKKNMNSLQTNLVNLNITKLLKKNIFYKNINYNKYKLVPFNVKVNYVGYTKYFPADSKEWRNKVYFFNSNYMKNLPVYDININKLLKSYFNLYLGNKIMLVKHISSYIKGLSFNKIYVSKPEIKHTSSKAIITVYIFYREVIPLIKNIDKLKKKVNLSLKFAIIPLLLKKNLLKNKKNFFFNTFYTFLKGKKNWSNNINLQFYSKIFKFMLYKELIFLRRHKFKLNLNNYKFSSVFLHKLGILISKIFNKKIEFNIVNLQSIALNTDIFTEFLKQKLSKKRKKINVGRIMNFVRARVKLPKENSIIERGRLVKNIDFNLLENKYKNININSMVSEGNLDNILKGLNNYNNIYLEKKLSIAKYIFLKKKSLIFKNKYFSLIKKTLFNSIKYKNIAGIRLEIKGRLTRRYRADRAIYRVRWKGGLKNTDSAFKGLSTVTFRGYANSNVEYSLKTSKRRIGAFAVKGWISGK